MSGGMRFDSFMKQSAEFVRITARRGSLRTAALNVLAIMRSIRMPLAELPVERPVKDAMIGSQHPRFLYEILGAG